MTACCCSGYRPLRGIRLDECNWPPRLAPAGPWEICNCAEGEIVRRQQSEIVVADDQKQPNPKTAPICQPPPTCSTCSDPDPGAPIEWHEHWRTWLCPECGSVLAEEKP